MNEKLYDIALGVLKDYPALESWTFNNKELEKFVEIIVNECADLCDRFQERNVGMQPAECAGAIRHMFGISK